MANFIFRLFLLFTVMIVLNSEFNLFSTVSCDEPDDVVASHSAESKRVSNFATSTGSGEAQGSDSDDRRRTDVSEAGTQRSKHRVKGAGHRRRKPEGTTSPSQGNQDDFENPVFPPRSDGFWKKESALRNPLPQSKVGKRKHHGGARSHRPAKPTSSQGEGSSSSKETTDSTDDDRPNIILIITDDQDIELGSMEYMPETLREFRENGVEFRHGYVTTPMCCPSRSSMLTGLYVHNHEVYTNNDNCSSVAWRQQYEQKTFAYQLWKSGYYTSYIGKYLNKYDGSHIPQGWDEWNALLMNSKFYNYTINRNGEKFRYGNTYEYDYYPDLITNDTMDFLNRVSRADYRVSENDESPQSDGDGGERKPTIDNPLDYVEDSTSAPDDEFPEAVQTMQGELPDAARARKRKPVKKPTEKKRKPFLLVVSYPAPHGPEDSAPQYSRLFFNSTPHHTPSYNYAPNLDKQWILRVTEKMTNQLKSFTNLLMTKRLQTLQSVDVAVKHIFDKLSATKLLDNTFVFYTSDHGYHVGQFGLIKGKSMPYEFDIRVPFFVRVPPKHSPNGVVQEATRKNIIITEPVLNIDLSPTFLEIGKVQVPSWIDGRSFLPIINRQIDNSNLTLNDSDWGHTWIIESSGRRENPVNQLKVPEGRKRKHKAKPVGSRKNHYDADEDDTLRQLCLLHPHPCLPRQKKYCKVEKNQIRFRKCRIGVDYSFPFVAKIGGNSSDARCKCKRGRRATTASTTSWNWEEERSKIDQEIEDLKIRIDNLREARRKMRTEWILTASGHKYKNSSGPGKHRRKDKHGFFVDINASRGRPRSRESDRSQQASIVPSPPAEEESVSIRPKVKFPKGSTSDLRDHGNPQRSGVLDGEKMHDDDDYVLPTSFHRSEEESDDEDTEDDGEEDDDEDDEDHDDSHQITESGRSFTPSSRQSSQSSLDDSNLSHRRGKTNLEDRSGKRHRGRHPATEYVTESDPAATNCECEISPKALRKIEKEERKRKKLISKIRKKQKFLHRIEDPDTRAKAETCGTEEKMNCFWHDSDHWRTPPLWTDGSFCFCMNANNNSYTCLRSVNSTHDYLYCQFLTGFKMYFDLSKDPHELHNAIRNLPAKDEEWMLKQLLHLKSCQGQDECWPDVVRSKENTRSMDRVDQPLGRNGSGKRKLPRTGKRKQV